MPITDIFTTHHHWDHAGGNNAVRQVYQNCKVYGGLEDNVEGCTNPVQDKDVIKFFGDTLQMICHHTPCHTKGHMLYQLESGEAGEHEFTTEMCNEYMIVKGLDRCIFTGDTVFVGGCGFFMEGNAP